MAIRRGMGMKPLVFLLPLSERLQQLKDSVEESAEAENIEIFEVETLDEFNELSPHLGQYLAMCSNPKLCARLLQLNTRNIKRSESKVILLSAKQYPRKTIDRLNKLGLTDFIMENVAAKTLQYKVKLQMRSIKIQEDEEEEVVIKHEEEEGKKEEQKVSESDGSNDEEETNDKKVLAKEEQDNSPKSYPGKASLVIDESEDPELSFSAPTDSAESEDESQQKVGRRSESQAGTWAEETKVKTVADLEQSAEEKKKNLPWHKAKEEALKSGKNSTDKIDNVWSSQKNAGVNLKERAEAEKVAAQKDEINRDPMEGDSSTDHLEGERKGEIGEQEEAIETHWEGEVLNYEKEKKDYGEEESLYDNNKLDGHYEGEIQSTDKIDEDFDPSDTNHQEGKKENMVGVSKTENKEDLLQGDTVKELINQEDLQTESEGTDSYEAEMEGSDLDLQNNLENPLLQTDSNMGNNIQDEMNASLEEDRKHKDKQTMEMDPSDNSMSEEDLSADTQTSKQKSDPLAADSETSKMDNRLDTGSSKDGLSKRESEYLQTRGLGASKNGEEDKERTSSLLEKIKKNREKNAPKKQDGFLRSPSAKKSQEGNSDKDKFERMKANEAHLSEEDQNQQDPTDFSSDRFEDNAGQAETEIQDKDDFSGENKGEHALEDMDGESTVDQMGEDLQGNKTGVDHLGDDLYGENAKVDNLGPDNMEGGKPQATLDVEMDEEKRKKRLEELYALKKEKLKELEERERKNQEALAKEEGLYDKKKKAEENELIIDEKEKNSAEVEMAGEQKHGKSGQENLDEIKFEKSQYDEAVLQQRMRHEHEEVQVDPSELSDKERELLKDIKDWGEQTIDYRKIRAGEEGITVERDGDGGGTEFKVVEKDINEEEEEKIYEGKAIEGDIEEEQSEEEGDNIIHPNSKGIETVIKVLNTYFEKDIKPSQILNQVAELINKERGFGITSFYYRSHNSTEYNEIHSGHENLMDDDRFDRWNKFKETKFKKWTETKLPTWSDKTFQDEKIQFIYPYFEGVDHLGFAVVTFTNGMTVHNAPRIEIGLESARSVYLSQRHKENGEEAIYNQLKSMPTEGVPSPAHTAESTVEEAPRKYMEAKDNLIVLEKQRALKEEEEKQRKIEEEKKANPVKKMWKRFFG